MIDQLAASPSAFDMFFSAPAKLSNIGHNNPAFGHQAADIIYYYRAAYRLPVGRNRARILRSALNRISITKPLAIGLYLDIQSQIAECERA